ncbi:MAG: STAS-like domain-containing protein [Sphingobacteriales bacterium]
MQVATKHFLKISSEFSETPGARYYTDGQDSGQEFYEKFLHHAFKEAFEDNSILTIDLDGTEGYATSFLDEAFMRLTKEFGKNEVLSHIKIISTEEPDWISEIDSYIKDVE